MFHEVVIGNCRLFHADALNVLPELGACADLLVTDPPYKLTSGGTGSGAMGGKFADEVYDNTGFLMDVIQWQQIGVPLYRALKDDCDAYVMCEDKNVFAAHGAFVGAGFKFHSMLTWDKISPSRTRYYMKDAEHTLCLCKGDVRQIEEGGEFTLFMWKGRAFDIANGGDTRVTAMPRPNNPVHPTQKPVELMAMYIRNSTQPGDIVLDPFMGAGSTLVAAVQEGRCAIGIEKDAAHFETACARVRAAIAHGDVR